MTRRKHGKYNSIRRLPDNTGIPVGSGLYVWLYQEVKSRLKYGSGLVEEASMQGTKKTEWLLARLRRDAAFESEAAHILQEFAARKKRYEAARRQWQRLRQIAVLQQQMQERPTDTFLQRQIERVQREVEKAQQRWHFGGEEIAEFSLLRNAGENGYNGKKGEDDGEQSQYR